MRSGTPGLRFSYADNIDILGFGRTNAESAAAAQHEVNNLLDWARNNAVPFDTNKSEVVQFPGQYRKTSIGIYVNKSLIEPSQNVCWLGVYLDP